jgi:hypothetical protein
MKHTIITLTAIALLANCKFAYSQSPKEEIAAINSSILDARYTTGFEGSLSFYYDADGLLRKFVDYFEYPGSTFFLTGYYDEEGQLISLFFGKVPEESHEYNGTVSVVKHNPYTLAFDYQYRESWYAHDWTHVYGESTDYPELIGFPPLSRFSCTDSLKTAYAIDKSHIINNFKSKRVRFAAPQVGDNVFINKNNVSLHSSPSNDSNVINIANIGTRFNIVEVLPKEKSDNEESFSWYRIEYYNMIAYVFGEFLEPVERMVND